MVTNINLAVSETEKKTILTGKSTLVLCIFLVLLTLLVFGAISFFKNRFSTQVAQAEIDINEEKTKMTGAAYSELFDFQERLTLLDGVLDNHSYWDIFLRNFSQYIIPEVRLTNLSFSEKDKNISIKGVASNFEALSREIILLKTYPGAKSVEFKNASEGTSGEERNSGAAFELNIKTDPSVFKK